MYNGTVLITHNRSILYTDKSPRFLPSGTKSLPFIYFQGTWRAMERQIASAMIERRRSRGHEVHAIRDSTRALIRF